MEVWLSYTQILLEFLPLFKKKLKLSLCFWSAVYYIMYILLNNMQFYDRMNELIIEHGDQINTSEYIWWLINFTTVDSKVRTIMRKNFWVSELILREKKLTQICYMFSLAVLMWMKKETPIPPSSATNTNISEHLDPNINLDWNVKIHIHDHVSFQLAYHINSINYMN